MRLLRRHVTKIGMALAIAVIGVGAQLNSDHRLSGCGIKGNVSSSGERIYHMPSQEYYDATEISSSKGEKWFCSEAEARGAGWRKSKV